jgi:myo-inositol 2-dehydrogenase / D-chiro-inositol 1-dehydrogenase
MTIHDFDMARFFIPETVEATAVGSDLFSDYIEEADDYDTATVVLRSRRGQVVTIVNSPRLSHTTNRSWNWTLCRSLKHHHT